MLFICTQVKLNKTLDNKDVINNSDKTEIIQSETIHSDQLATVEIKK